MNKKLFWGGFAGAIVVVIAIIVFVSLRSDSRMRELGEFYANWPVAQGKINNFTARFPQEPEYQSQELPIPDSDQSLKQEIFVGNSDRMSFFIAGTLYPSALTGDAETNLRTALDGMTNAIPDVQVVSSKFVVPFNQPHDYLEFEIKNSRNNTQYKGRIFAVDSALYQVYVTYPEAAYDDNEYTYFVNSFTIQ